MKRRALFLDRDGVIVREGDGLAARALEVLPGAASAIRAAREAGYLVIVVTNQPVIARGAMTEDDVRRAHAALGASLAEEGGTIDAFYVCPFLPPPRARRCLRTASPCDCRKPRPGMLLAAARDWSIDLGAASVLVGDRASDVAAGKRAGCRTVLVETGAHLAPPIESAGPLRRRPPRRDRPRSRGGRARPRASRAMKALVLCGGFGSRLGALTETTPKPLLPIEGRPLLAYTLALLARHRVRDVAINLHYLGRYASRRSSRGR